MQSARIELDLGLPEGALVAPSARSWHGKSKVFRARPQLLCKPLALLHAPTDIRLTRIRREECWDAKTFKLLAKSREISNRKTDRALPSPYPLDPKDDLATILNPGGDLFLEFSSELARPALLCHAVDDVFDKSPLHLLLGLNPVAVETSSRKECELPSPMALMGRARNAFRVEGLILESDRLSDLMVVDLKLGQNSQLVSGASIPAELFAGGWTPPLRCQILRKDLDATVTLWNHGPEPVRVRRCRVFGSLVQDSRSN